MINNIILDEKNLLSRGQTIQRLLRPVSKRGSGPAWQFGRPKFFDIKIIGTHDGSPPSLNFKDWRFLSIVPHYFIMYYEKWKFHDHRMWQLEEAYFHIYHQKRPQEIENDVVFLHCDPNEPEESKYYFYKCGPHVHVRTANEPINHSHIPLAGRQVDEILASLDNFDNALEWSIQLIRDEFLERFMS